jgi:dTDP-4-dehydrorhamnose reductase
MSQNILLFGATGMLGSDIQTVFSDAGHTVTPLSSKDCDLTDEAAVLKAIDSQDTYDLIINCAAYTAVDDCETHKDLALDVNGKGPLFIAKAAKQCGDIPILHFSTDYVFDGTKTEPYVETDKPNPISVYGFSKWLGEQGISIFSDKYYIVRVQWLYGKNGPNFIHTMSKLLKEKESLAIVDDQWGTPTHTRDIATHILDFIDASPEYGIYHFAPAGYTNWKDYTIEIQNTLGTTCTITGQRTEDYPRPADRPKNSRLNTTKWANTGVSLPEDWKINVEKYCRNLR